MKTLKPVLAKATFIAMFLFIAFVTRASNYEQALGQALQNLGSATNPQEMLSVADQFERIANSEKNQWLPFYYASLSCANAVMQYNTLSAKERDQVLDRAQKLLEQAMDTEPKESEIYALLGLVYQLKISNPIEGATLSRKSGSVLEKAKNLNNANPRTYYIQGTNAFHTPKMFGGGPEKARPLFEKAKQLFDAQQPSNPFLPIWGKEHNEQMLNQCR